MLPQSQQPGFLVARHGGGCRRGAGWRASLTTVWTLDRLTSLSLIFHSGPPAGRRVAHRAQLTPVTALTAARLGLHSGSMPQRRRSRTTPPSPRLAAAAGRLQSLELWHDPGHVNSAGCGQGRAQVRLYLQPGGPEKCPLTREPGQASLDSLEHCPDHGQASFAGRSHSWQQDGTAGYRRWRGGAGQRLCTSHRGAGAGAVLNSSGSGSRRGDEPVPMHARRGKRSALRGNAPRKRLQAARSWPR